jgi:phosphoserine phosphatase RsbU/P
MKILLAEDDAFTRNVLRKTLTNWGHEVIEVSDGKQAWRALAADDSLRLAILDWIMPVMDGIEVVRRVRAALSSTDRYVYLILLTQKDSKEDIVAGLAAGADDYVIKPFDRNELQVRIRSGERIVELQCSLASTNAHLRDALVQVKKLSGFLPLCASCKRIRDAKGDWQQIESYISNHSEAHFSHSICPECAKQLYPDLFED